MIVAKLFQPVSHPKFLRWYLSEEDLKEQLPWFKWLLKSSLNPTYAHDAAYKKL